MSRPEHLPQGNVRPRSFSQSVLENGNAIALASTGHDKQNVTVDLSYCQDGSKLINDGGGHGVERL